LRLSVVLPVYNEAGNLQPLYDELIAALDGCAPDDYEILFVDDGSTDGTAAELNGLADRDERVKLITFRRNFGQTAAIMAGVEHSDSDIIVLMDADRQNDPADIPVLLAEIDKGWEVVSGWRKNRQDTFLTRRFPSMLANGLISKVTGVKLHDFGCTLKAYKREALEGVNLYGDMHRFIPVFAQWTGASVTEVVTHHRARTVGVSKYGLGRIFRVVLDLLVLKLFGDFRTRPLHFFGGMGLFLQVLGLLCGVHVLYNKFQHNVLAKDQPFLQLAVFLFLIGLNLLMLGLLAEMLMRIYYESQNKSIYTVRSRRNLPEPDKK